MVERPSGQAFMALENSDSAITYGLTNSIKRLHIILETVNDYPVLDDSPTCLLCSFFENRGLACLAVMTNACVKIHLDLTTKQS